MSGALQFAQVRICAPAKINLFFELLARRTDGFHGIETIMTTVSIYDSLSFTATESPEIDFRADWSVGLQASSRKTAFLGEIPQDNRNLVVRALHLLQREVDSAMGAKVRLTKRIPAGAGLGGGSADAAAALVAGNLGWNLDLSKQRLGELAAEVGSDVSFFLGAPTALCTGRGEQIQELPRLPRCEIVVVHPPVALGTAEVYRQSRVPTVARRFDSAFVTGQIRHPAGLGNILFNRLQQPAAEISPWISRLETEFCKAPFVAHQMSGSGSSYFGICATQDDARRAEHKLRAARIGHVVRAKSGMPLSVRPMRPSMN
jgi:4-diphosphocytidyl-2-C-methyl-D-erythritol kinase